MVVQKITKYKRENMNFEEKSKLISCPLIIANSAEIIQPYIIPHALVWIISPPFFWYHSDNVFPNEAINAAKKERRKPKIINELFFIFVNSGKKIKIIPNIPKSDPIMTGISNLFFSKTLERTTFMINIDENPTAVSPLLIILIE